MFKAINVFMGGSTDKNISQDYYDAVVELGKKINERKDYTIIFDWCLGLLFYYLMNWILHLEV